MKYCHNCGSIQQNETPHLNKETSCYSQTDNDPSNSSSTSGVLDMDCGTPCSYRSCEGTTSKQDFAHHLWLDWDCDSDKFHNTEVKKVAADSYSANLQPGRYSSDQDSVNNNVETEDATPSLRRWSYEAAISNQHNQASLGVLYPRYRSASFQAALDAGQQSYSAADCASEPVTNLPSSFSAASHAQNGTLYSAAIENTSSHLVPSLLNPPGQILSDIGSIHYGSSNIPSLSNSASLDFSVNSSYLTCTDSSHNHAMYSDSIRESFQSLPRLVSMSDADVVWRESQLSVDEHTMPSCSYSSNLSADVSIFPR